ncbi:putative E3 ubiquitin-protein ligase arkadia-A [Melia azedarach]|uniref:E3 ubiquitin-protein ligase arkadia-A n=1 Tax=Melia azedarach TaxID=155640 RepID=A0ACC1WV95_MELAZ|nr:putative E3 ubiquitin-protein ligase arkadia-A [Melia azedarach]
METELLKLKKLPSLQISRTSRNSNSDVDDYLGYTSLKDIIINSPTASYAINPEGNVYDFDSSNITIRNRLVKRAASAYIQSAAIMVARNQNYFVSVWGRIRSRTEITASCWNVYVRNPLHACFNPIYRFLASTVGFLWNRMTRIP